MSATQAKFQSPSWKRLEGQAQVSSHSLCPWGASSEERGCSPPDPKSASSLQARERARDVVADRRQSLAAASGALPGTIV